MVHLLGVHGNEFAHGIFERCGVRKRHMAVDATDALDADPRRRPP
jgi:hypothetical protein